MPYVTYPSLILLCFLVALDETGERLSVAFDEPWIHQFFTAPLLEPNPSLTENLIRSQRSAIPLLCRQVLVGLGHLLAVEVGDVGKFCAVQFRHGKLHHGSLAPIGNLI